MEIINFGIARSGIHVYILWLINNNCKVLFYNNILDHKNLKNRIISNEDTRIQNIKNKFVNENDKYNLKIFSFESQIINNNYLNELKINNILNNKTKLTISIRNPFNNFASILEYINNNGSSKVVHNLKNNFAEYWIKYSNFIIKNKPIFIIYDKFILDDEYRKKIAEKIGLKLIDNHLLKSNFGGGSSFKNNINYLNRYDKYKNNELMKNIKNNIKINENWKKINNIIL